MQISWVVSVSFVAHKPRHQWGHKAYIEVIEGCCKRINNQYTSSVFGTRWGSQQTIIGKMGTAMGTEMGTKPYDAPCVAGNSIGKAVRNFRK